jgi:hypothetical protein
MPKPDWIHGNSPIEARLNIRNELKRLKSDPVLPLIVKLKGEDGLRYRLYSDELLRYVDAYWYYYLSLERILPALGYAMRWEKSMRYVSGRWKKLTDSQKKLSHNYHAIRRYLSYDFVNYMIHARILMDRVAGVSRRFISGSNLPSFTSFNDHKKFFVKLSESSQLYGEHEEYADYIRNNTGWFDMPLKEVRDHFLIHHGPSHNIGFMYDEPRGWDMFVCIMVPDLKRKGGYLEKTIFVSIPALARDIEKFLCWFNNYGLQTIERNTG